MKTEKLYPAIQMTGSCNKRCRACLRTPGGEEHNIGNDDFKKYCEDLQSVSEKYRLAAQFVTGGEPTIWRDGEKDIVDILSRLDKLEFIEDIVLPTNGKVFEDRDFAKGFLKRLSHNVNRTLIIGLSIADYQNNFFDNECTALENLLSICNGPDINAIVITLVTLSVEGDTSEQLHKFYPKVYQRVTPLAPLGRAKNMADKCPSLSLIGNDKASLGSFLEHFKKDAVGKLKIGEDDFFKMPNAEIMDRLSLFNNCGKSPFITGRWHYCLPFMENPRFDVCGMGQMKRDTIGAFIRERPFLQSIRKKGILTTVNRFKNNISQGAAESFEKFFSTEKRIPVAYRGCILCKELYDAGITREISRKIPSR